MISCVAISYLAFKLSGHVGHKAACPYLHSQMMNAHVQGYDAKVNCKMNEFIIV